MWQALVAPISDLIKSYFPPDMSEEQKAQFAAKEAEMQVAIASMLAQLGQSQEAELTKRLQADMASDSWLSKNIRPLVLVFLLVMYTVFAGISIGDNDINPIYADMLQDMLMAAFGFYFVSRGIEKVTDKIAAAWGKK
jgi:hypothetical protein